MDITFNLNSLLYNNDKEAIETLKGMGLYEKYKNFDKPQVSSIVNSFKLRINDDDSIDFIKKKLSLMLIEKIDEDKNKNKKCCFYCFNNNNNEVIEMKKSLKKDVFKDFSKKKEEEKEEDLLDDLDFSDEDEDSDVESIDIDDIMAMDGGGKKNKIFVCNNCKKIYFFKRYFSIEDYEKYDDIYPFPDLFYMWNGDRKIGFNLIDIQKKGIEYKKGDMDLTSPFENVTTINRKYLLKKESDKEKQNKKLTNYLNLVTENDKKLNKYLKNESFLLYNNYNIDDNIINISYLPELTLYNKNNDTKCLEIYSKLYWPYVDYGNYFLKFIKKDMSYNFINCIHKTVDRDFEKYKIEDIIIGWGDKYQKYSEIMEEFKKIKQVSKYEEYTNKIFYKINDFYDNTSILNFTNIYHLFEMDEEVPFMTSYIPEKSYVIEKIFKPMGEYIKNQNWKLYNKNIIHFRLLLPKELRSDDENNYFQVNLYDNMKIEVNVSLQTKKANYITEKELLKVNEKVNNFIKRLNKLNIFVFDDIQIPLSKEKFEDWNKEKSNTQINSMNFYLKVESKINESDMLKVLGNLNKCMRIYFHKDFDFSENNFRYIRINNVNLSDVTDRYLYHTYQTIVSELNIENDNDIKKILIKSLMDFFDKSYEEALSIYENYMLRYKTFMIKPLNYGLYFNVKENEEWKNVESDKFFYKINVMGMRSYKDWDKMKDFILRLLNLLDKLNENSKDIQKFKEICNFDKLEKKEKIVFSKSSFLEHQQERFECMIQERVVDEDLKNIKGNKELIKKKRMLKKRIQDLNTSIDKKKKQMKKTNIKSIVSYLSRLQEIYPNLKFKCTDCGKHADTKECKECGGTNLEFSYSKRCQTKRQPMGTGAGIQPTIENFNKEAELERFEHFEKVSCNIGQLGGGGKKYSKEIYENWGMENKPKVYSEKMKIENCTKQSGYKKGELKQIALLYDIDIEGKKKNEICKEIIQKIKKSEEENISSNNLMILKEELNKILRGESSNYKKNFIEFLIEYYNKKVKYTFENHNLDKIIKKMNINISHSKNKESKMKSIMNNLVKIFGNDYEIMKDLFIKFFGLKPALNKLKNEKNDTFVKNLLLYEVYMYTNKWSVDHIAKMYKKIFNTTAVIDGMDKKVKEHFNRFKEQLLVVQPNKKFNELDLDFDKFADDIGILIRKDKNHNIVQSTMSHKGKALSCPNYNDKTNSSLIGFLPMEGFENKNNLSDAKVRDMICQPCCFGSKKDENNKVQFTKNNYVRNVLFCKGKISWNEYLKKIEEQEVTENYISSNSTTNRKNNFGLIPELLNNIFNNYHNLYNVRNKSEVDRFLFKNYKNNILKDSGFVLKGVTQTQYKIFEIISEALKISKTEIINRIEKLLKSKKYIFESLNSGKISIRFKTIDDYINFLKQDNIEPRWCIDILSQQNLFEKHKNGLNIIIFTESMINSERDVSIENVEDFNYIDLYDIEKTNLFLFKYPNGDIEPIVLKYPGKNKYTMLFDKKMKLINKKLFNEQEREIFIDFIKFIKQWIETIFDNNQITSIKINKMMDIKVQFIDNFNKVLYVLLDDNILLPVLPSKIDINNKVKQFNSEVDLKEYLGDLKNTIKNVNEFANKIGDEDFDFSKIILDNESKNITAIELLNGLIVPINVTKYEDKQHKKYSKSQNKLFFNINNAIINETIPKEPIDFLKEKYDFELYQRLFLEISNYIGKHDNIRETLKYLFGEDNFENRKVIKDVIYEFIDKVIVLKEPELIDYTVMKSYKDDNNIRNLCETNPDEFCEKNKLVVPYSRINIMIGLFIENMLNNSKMRHDVINNKVRVIIDDTNFVDTDNHIFIKKEPFFIK
jgi:hypothetical protein